MRRFSNKSGSAKSPQVICRRTGFILLLVVVLLSGLLSCSRPDNNKTTSHTTAAPQPTINEPPPYNTGTLKTGPEQSLVSQMVVPASGGEVVVNRPGDPLNGLTIMVPSGAYPDTIPLEISSAPITSTTFANVNPITPLIMVNNGGDFADSIMTVKIPVKIPAGQFAMGFFYDAEKQRLEGIPTVAMDDSSITLATCHFSYFFVSSVAETKLTGPDIVDSGFWPMRDEWQIENDATGFIGGRCAGTSASEIWYYYEKPDGPNAHLYGRYEGTDGQKTPDIWQDDVNAIRLTTSVQADYEDRGNTLRDQLEKLLRISYAVTIKEFTYAIMATGGPQMALTHEAGHALVVTGVKDNNLLISDPNFPGQLRVSQWNNGAIEYVLSDSPSSSNWSVYYMAVGAFVPWDKIGARWAEMKTGKVGTDRFPPVYNLYFPSYHTSNAAIDKYGNWQSLLNPDGSRLQIHDGMSVPFPTIQIFTETPNWKPAWATSKPDFKFEYELATLFSQKFLTRQELNPGSNLIGVQSNGYTESGKYNHGGLDSHSRGWLDFDWITINYQPLQTLAIEPATWAAQPGQKQTFTANSPTTLIGLRFRWLVDGVEVQNSPKLTLDYALPDSAQHKITVEALDDAEYPPKKLTDAAATINGPGKVVPPAPGKASVKITSPKNGATITSSTFNLTISYTLSKPGGDILLELDLLSNGVVFHHMEDTEKVTDQSGTLTIPAGLGDAPGAQVDITVTIEGAADEIIFNYVPSQ